MAMAVGHRNPGGPAARAELLFAPLMWKLTWERVGTKLNANSQPKCEGKAVFRQRSRMSPSKATLMFQIKKLIEQPFLEKILVKSLFFGKFQIFSRNAVVI